MYIYMYNVKVMMMYNIITLVQIFESIVITIIILVIIK